MTKSIKSLALLLAFASVCLADGFTDDNQTPHEPFVSEKGVLFRFSRSALKGPKQVKYEQQQQQQQIENDRLTRVQQEQQVDLSGQNVQQVTGADQLPAFSGGVSKTTGSQVASADAFGQQQQQQEQQNLSSSSTSSFSASKHAALAKTITTTTTTTTTTQNAQGQPQVSQIKEVHVHTVPLSEAVHYANYVVMPSSKAAHLEESSSSSSSSQKSSSSSSTSETEQVAIAPSPSVIVNPAPAVVAPDCVLSRVIVHRPVTSQLVVQVPSEVQVSHSSSSQSSKIVSQTVAAEPPRTVYRSYFIPQPAHIVSARVVAAPVAPVNDGIQEEHHSSEQHSSRRESHGLGHSVSSSSSSSSSSRSSKSTSSSTTTTSQQTAALVAPPPPTVVRTVIVQPQVAAPIVAIKSAPLVHVTSGRSNDVSVDVNHHQSGPNYNYGYSIKQRSSEPGTKGLLVGEQVVYSKK